MRFGDMCARPVIVIEIGNRLTRIGFAGEFVPREIFRSELVDPMEPYKKIAVFGSNRSDEEQEQILVKFLKNIIFRKLLTTARDRRIIVVESLLTPTRQRIAVAQAFFECPSLSPYSVLFAPSHLLCSLPFNSKTCLVVDLGVNEAAIFAVVEGFLVLSSWQATSAGGCSTVEQRVVQLLLLRDEQKEEGTKREKMTNEAEALYRAQAEDIVTRFCFATTMRRGLKLQCHGVDPTCPIDPPPPDVILPLPSSKSFISSYNRQMMTSTASDTVEPLVGAFANREHLLLPGYVREAAAEVIFQDNGLLYYEGEQAGGIGDDDGQSLPQAMLNCVAKAGIDVRRELLKNIVVVGGLSRMPGLLARLKAELLRLIATATTSPADTNNSTNAASAKSDDHNLIAMSASTDTTEPPSEQPEVPADSSDDVRDGHQHSLSLKLPPFPAVPSSLSPVPTTTDLRFHQFPTQVAGQLFCSWLGGSMLGALESDDLDRRAILRDRWLADIQHQQSKHTTTSTTDELGGKSTAKQNRRSANGATAPQPPDWTDLICPPPPLPPTQSGQSFPSPLHRPLLTSTPFVPQLSKAQRKIPSRPVI